MNSPAAFLADDLQSALQEIARSQFARQPRDHTLQPTALVNELWLKILQTESEPPTTVSEFRAWAATVIRNILISHARAKASDKRGGDRLKVQLQTAHGDMPEEQVDLLDLDEELRLLEKADAVAARVVDLRFFGGMDHRQIGVELDISERNSQRKWAMARSWLRLRFQQA